MKVHYSRVFRKDYQGLPEDIRARADKQLALFVENPRHPSLRVQKIRGSRQTRWEGRITRGYRFTFEWEGDTVFLRRMGTHEIIDQEAQG